MAAREPELYKQWVGQYTATGVPTTSTSATLHELVLLK
jgi:hypothetical protein